MYYFAFLQTQQLKWQKQLQGKITFMSSLTVFFCFTSNNVLAEAYWAKVQTGSDHQESGATE